REWQWAIELIEHALPVFTWGTYEYTRVQRWLEQLPIEIVRTRPRLCLAYALALFLTSPPTVVESWLRDAQVAMGASSSASEQDIQENLRGEIATLSAIVAIYYYGETDMALAYCQEAHLHLSAQNLTARSAVAYAQSMIAHALGDVVSATQRLREAFAFAQHPGDLSTAISYLG